MELTERKKQILKSVCDAYISGGEPVGSKYLTQNGKFSLSSATLRNEMSELEEMGLLEQPHTSSGRVPSTMGYKTYIKLLMEDYRLTVEEISVLNELMDFKLGELSKIMEQATNVISELTNYTALTMIKNGGVSVKRFEGVLIDEKSILLVLICDDDKIRNCHVKFDHFVDAALLDAVVKALNKKLINLSADEITLQVILDVEEALGIYSYDSKVVLRSIFNTLKTISNEEIHLGGITKLLSYPEFYNVSKARDVIETLEKKKGFVNDLIADMEDDVNVYFGDESDSTALVPDSSLVFVPIKHGGKTLGGIGVIGPKRMDYKKVIASLKYFASGLFDEE